MKLPRLRIRFRYERPEPVEERPIVSTRVEHDLAELNISPVMIEPSNAHRQIAVQNMSFYLAHRQAGFDEEEAYDIFTRYLEATLEQGPQR